MKYQVKGVMKESGQEVDTTVDANDEEHAVALANQYGILPSNVRLLDVQVPTQAPYNIASEPAKTTAPRKRAKTLGRLSVALGALSFLMAPMIFGSVAILGGAIAANRGNRLGWLGMGLGMVGIIYQMAIKLAMLL